MHEMLTLTLNLSTNSLCISSNVKKDVNINFPSAGS